MPEKRLVEIPRPTRELYDKALAAFQRQNFEYAVAILNQVLQNEPAFYDAREALRAAQFKKVGGGSGFFKRFLGTAGSSPLLAKGQVLLRTNPIEALSVAEQILNSDPGNTQAHKLLADAALASDLPRTAVLSLEIAFKNSPKDTDIAMRLGEALAHAGLIERAEAIYSELLRANPHDQGIAQRLQELAAHKTLKEGGYEALAGGSGSYRDILKDKDEAVALEQENRLVKSDVVASRLIQEYEARLAKEPRNLKLIRSIGELYAQKKDFDRALQHYNQIIATEGTSDPSLERAIADTTLRKFDYELAQLDPSSPTYAADQARIQQERQMFELQACQQRVDRFPTDLQLRFELGELYFKLGKIGEAIQEFQKAKSNPHIRIAAQNYLGQCFMKRSMFDLAARTFEGAIKEKVVFDDEKKELIYELGVAYEKMGKPDQAIEQFKQIYESDIGFKDVAAKVDAYYANR